MSPHSHVAEVNCCWVLANPIKKDVHAAVCHIYGSSSHPFSSLLSDWGLSWLPYLKSEPSALFLFLALFFSVALITILLGFLLSSAGKREKERKQLLIELLCAGIWFWHIFAHLLCTNSLWFQDCHLYFIDMEIRDETGLRSQNMDLLETGLGFILTDSKGPVFPTLSSCLPEYVFNHVPHSFICSVSDSVNSAHYRLLF